MTPEARIAAAIALLEGVAAQPRRPADAIAAEFFRARRFIGGGDRRAVSDLAWGALRQRIRLEWHLAAVGAPPSPRLLVLAQMVMGQKVPAATALRAFAGGRFGPEPASAAEAAAARALEGRTLADAAMPEGPRLNLPEWALPGLRRRFGDALAAEAAALEGQAPLDLRANALKTTRDAVLAALGRPAAAMRFSPWGVRMPARTSVAAHPLFKDGAIEVQDEGSQLIAALVGARPGMRVADYCAGAAGKTLAMAATMDNRGRIVACDVSAPRLAGADKRLRRAGVHNAETHLLSPGDRWAKRRAGQFDRVLVDAPCTGTGTWRRNPDARSRTTATDLAELLAKQGEILSMSAQLVRPGGRLAYATCSLLPEEDEEQVERFLAANPGFAVVPLPRAWAEAGLPGAPPCEGPHMALSPAAHGTDGFFCAVLERTA